MQGKSISLFITFQSGTRVDEVQLMTHPIPFAIAIHILANMRPAVQSYRWPVAKDGGKRLAEK